MALTSVSPIDGRYEGKTKCLKGYFSEMALMRYRIYTEINYLIKLLETPMLKGRVKSAVDTAKLRSIIEITEDDAAIIKAFETTGYDGTPATNHDVKAIEYFIKRKLKEMGMDEILEYVHFALTSEDINNISYGLMIRDAVNNVVVPEILSIYEKLYPLTQADDELRAKHIEEVNRKQEKASHTANYDNSSADAAEMICPRCGGRLVMRVAERGENIGKRFWGCSNFPKCRYIRNLPDNQSTNGSPTA